MIPATFFLALLRLLSATTAAAAPLAANNASLLLLSAGRDLAQRFQTMPACLEARRGSIDSNSLYRMTLRPDGHPDKKWLNQQLFVMSAEHLSPSLHEGDPSRSRAVYVRNQKAASTSLKFATAALAGETRQYYSPFKAAHRHRHHRHRRHRSRRRLRNRIKHHARGQSLLGPKTSTPRPLPCRPGDVYFTFVRDPLDAFLSGWREATCRSDVPFYNEPGEKEAYQAESLRMSRADPSAVLSRFVRDIASKAAYLGRESEHAWPQSLKIDALPVPRTETAGIRKEKKEKKKKKKKKNECSYGFIGKVDETLAQSLAALFSGVKLPHDAAFHRRNASTSPCKEGLAHVSISDADMRAICAFLAADYVCFDYPLPGRCR